MTSNNETVSLQNLWAGNITKFMTSEGSSALKIHCYLQMLTEDPHYSKVYWTSSYITNHFIAGPSANS